MMRLGGETARRVIAILVLAGMLVGLGVGVAELARAQVPPLPIPLPTGEPSASPTPQPEPEPEPEPEPRPEPTFSPEPEPTWAPSESFPVEPYSPAPIPTQDAVPGVAPTAAPAANEPPAMARPVGVSPVAAALPGAFGVMLAAVLSVAGLGSGILALAKRGLFAARGQDGGIDVEATKRWRLLGGLGLLGAAAVVGLIGWLKISLETQVAVQMVYVASTGFAVLVLAVAGGSLVIADQLRADERRMREVEDALVNLAGQIHPLVSEPPRVIARGKRAEVFDPDVTTELR